MLAVAMLAWCDGITSRPSPSALSSAGEAEPGGAGYWAYHQGLAAARAHLDALGAPLPDDLPPFAFE